MIKDSIDIQPPFSKKKREFVAEHGVSRPDSIYTQVTQFDKRGSLERETWKLDNGQEVIDLDDAEYISKSSAEEIRMQTLEPSALMKLAKKQPYFGSDGLICMLYRNKIYFSSKIVKIIPPFKDDFEPEYDLGKDFEDFKKR